MVKAQTDTLWATLVGGFFTSIAYLMGGVDNLLICLSILMIVDFGTGLMVAYGEKNISSQRAYRGVAKKVTMLLFIIVVNQVDIIFTQQNGELRYYVLMLLIATEGISLTENAAKMGLPIPAFWTNALVAIKEKGGAVEIKNIDELGQGGKENGEKTKNSD